MTTETSQTKARRYRARHSRPRGAQEITAVIPTPEQRAGCRTAPVESDVRMAPPVGEEATEVDSEVAARIEISERQDRPLAGALPAAAEAAHRDLVSAPLRGAGKYCLVSHLASGRTSEVYLARADWPAGFAHDLVFKVLRGEHARSARRVAALTAQARLLSSLHHENIVRVLDSGSDGDSYFLVMDYLHGVTLRTALQAAPGGLPLDLALSVVVSCAQALHYARARQAGADTLYLGLALQHVMTCADGSIKITRLHRTTSAAHTRGRHDRAHVAPEHLRGDGGDARSDVFALGALLYQLTTGEPPRSEPAWPAEHLARVPGPLATLLMTALDHDPARRHRDALEFAQAARHAAEQLTLRLGDATVCRFVERLFREELRALVPGKSPPAALAPRALDLSASDIITLVRAVVREPTGDRRAAVPTGARADTGGTTMPWQPRLAHGTAPVPTYDASELRHQDARRDSPEVSAPLESDRAEVCPSWARWVSSRNATTFISTAAAFAAGLIAASLLW